MSEFTLEQLINAGYQVKAAPIDAWRKYDEQNPIPGYFNFDWFSSRHPDLYHHFALSTDGLMDELDSLFDLTGLQVIEVGAGTGRAAIKAARKARKVTAVDVFESVVFFGKEMVRQAGLKNVDYARGDCRQLPFPDNAFDVLINSWAILDYAEAYRVLKPDGCLIQLGAAPGSLCGELTALLADVFPALITEVAPADRYAAACPDMDLEVLDTLWNGLPVKPPTVLHDFTYIVDYVDPREAAAMVGRLYGPVARQYLLDRRQSTLSWRLRIAIARMSK